MSLSSGAVMRNGLILLLVCQLAWVGQFSRGDDFSDVEADTETSMADAEAAHIESQELRGHASRERAEAEGLRQQAKRAQREAENKHRQAQGDITRIDDEIRRLKAEQARLQREIKAQGSQLSVEQKKVNAAQIKLNKVKGETLAARQLREERAAHIADLQAKARELTEGTGALTQELAQAKADFSRSQGEEASASLRLEQLKREQAARHAQLETQLAQLKERYRQSHARTSAVEAEIRERRRRISKLEEETKVAESEVQQSDARLADATDRLHELRERNAAREAELEHRQKKAGRHLSSRDVETEEALMRIEKARDEQLTTRSIASADQNSVSVQLTRRSALASRRTLSRDCQVFERPDGHSRVLGTKRAGSSVAITRGQDSWLAFPVEDGRQGYLARGCF